jgi:predicted phage terminase large subunit-like protein
MNAPLSPFIMLDAIKRERQKRKAESSLLEFTKQAWEIIEPGVEFKYNWHLEAIAEHLEAVHDGEITNLLINIPPGCMKSIMVSVMLSPWEWVSNPKLRFMSASYGADLAIRDAMKSRLIIGSQWYQERWPHVQVSRKQDEKTKYELVTGGWRLSTSVGGRGTGEHPDRKLVDDPHNVKQAESDAERATALQWFDLTLGSRGVTRGAATIVVMQRLNSKDISGHILDDIGGYDHLCIPMSYERDGRKSVTVLGFKDPRKKEGELLWPDLYDAKKVTALSKTLGEYGTAGQLQQRPSPAGGGIIKVEHFQQWPKDKPLPMMEFVVQSYDGAFTKDHDNDPCGHLSIGIAQVGKKYCAFILDTWEDWLEYPEFRDRVVDDWRGATYGGEPGNKLNKPRRADVVLIEEKANGLSLLQDLRTANVPVAGYNPGRADKVMRAHQIAPILELDIVYIPESKKEPGKFTSWARPFVRRCELFPRDDHDDVVDCFTQAMIYCRDKGFFDLNFVEVEEPEEIDYAARKKKRNPYGA